MFLAPSDFLSCSQISVARNHQLSNVKIQLLCIKNKNYFHLQNHSNPYSYAIYTVPFSDIFFWPLQEVFYSSHSPTSSLGLWGSAGGTACLEFQNAPNKRASYWGGWHFYDRMVCVSERHVAVGCWEHTQREKMLAGSPYTTSQTVWVK